jgi:hypothetical protein
MERNVCLLFRGEVDNGSCDSLMQVEEQETLGISEEVCLLYNQALLETFHVDSSSILLFCQVYWHSISVAVFRNFQIIEVRFFRCL